MRKILAVVLLAAPLSVISQELPPGWRLPTRGELASEPLRKGSPLRFAKVIADFNGDGVDDEAFLLKSTRFSGEGLWVRLSDGKTGSRWIKLDEIRWGQEYSRVDLAMGVAAVPPGVHAYACFDDVKECDLDPQNRPKLKLRDPSLRYFKFESAASLYF